VSCKRTGRKEKIIEIGKDDLKSLLTTEDVERLTGHVLANNSVIVILFGPTWVRGLTEAVRKSGGVVFNSGMVSHD
jgi:hypothetical protein